MAVYFFDSSALVKRYVAETGSAWVEHITDPKQPNKIYVSAITGVEVISAITRRVRVGSIKASLAANVITDFRTDYKNQYEILSLTDNLVQQAMGLAENYGLRAYDAVQLAAALIINAHSAQMGIPSTGVAPLIVVASDVQLLNASAAEGLVCDDPLNHP